MKKILIGSGIPKVCVEPFEGIVDMTMPPVVGERFPQDEVLRLIPEYDAFFCFGTPLTKEILDAGKNLKAVANFGVGYDNIDWKYATEKNIFVVNTPQSVLQPTAEFTVALIMAISRGILMYDRKLRREKKCSSERFFNRDLMVYGKTLGLLGFGRIGKAVAQKCQGLGMHVIYYDPYRLSEEKEKELGATYMPLKEVVSTADVLSLHMPYTSENHHLFNYDLMKTMKKTAYLINAARGPIVNEADLVKALKEERIRGAAIDVFDNEPNVSDELLELENVVVTPHVASCIFESRVGMAQEALKGLIGILEGNHPANVINPQLFKK
ncbi:MAG: NAD(P)-dependent oxidoreductase [Ethanoligenens sp.]|uniref:NAD(P)-dependent oxidoreductase n=1 Tax=Ethanoligenens sp. TaxID=2099655 RepID=UPI0039EB31AA